MMKYGWNDNDWMDELRENGATKFSEDVCSFNLHLFLPAMKRKTMHETDEKALKALNEMVEMLNKHFAEIKGE